MEEETELKKECLAIFKAGIKAVDGYQAVKNFLKVDGEELHLSNRSFLISDFKHIYVIGAGKASANMALAIEEILGDRLKGGLVVVKYGHTVSLQKIKVMEAGHPIPDENGFKAAQRLVKFATGFAKGDLIFCLLSGGSSALLPLPVEGITLAEKQATTKLLFECGAPIYEVNKIRKHLSRIKGGGLAKIIYPATLVTLIISDVIGDKLEVIGSGPTVADPSTFLECQEIIERYHLADRIPKRVRKYISAGVKGIVAETPKPGELFFQKTFNFIVRNNSQCLEAARKKAQALGYHTLI
ncbi:MAG: glycerate-2-kinase family protein, partial [Desulfobacterota bacterium]|nr:glycerate-2-kinase family protein [Thermodesulfobacteriota bacterium]